MCIDDGRPPEKNPVDWQVVGLMAAMLAAAVCSWWLLGAAVRAVVCP